MSHRNRFFDAMKQADMARVMSPAFGSAGEVLYGGTSDTIANINTAGGVIHANNGAMVVPNA